MANRINWNMPLVARIFRSGTTVCVRPVSLWQWNVTLLSHPLADAILAKMLWQCVFKVSSDFLRNINKIINVFGDLRAHYTNDATTVLNYHNTTSRVLYPSLNSYITRRRGWNWYLGRVIERVQTPRNIKLWTVLVLQ